MVTAVSSTSTTSASAASSASSVLASDFDTFLQLLTTQLKNQDPTDPMDANQFTEQLVQFSQVEQQINMNKNLETMIAMLQSQQSSANLSYIGKVVDFDSNEVELAEGGTAFWSYDLPEDAQTVQYKILDEDGNVVRSGSMSAEDAGAGTSGRIEVAWDGTDADGNACEPGTYTLEVTAKDASGQVVDGTNVYARGYVEAVESIDGEQYLIVSGMKVLPEDVIAVFAMTDTDESDA
ncbi:MAG: flagellar hook assembly protein FlgD [Ferrovibrio sp.]|uniref:flagellar hook assembly protein FlgD n=1 Tax=Ferrovibrio sp. TaxID=1917215 RepID=UPI00261D2E7B|nr:flagellar hook capping FlgD N-terminal domain-containing protein [Ferrovibrio sp.]MCW0235077.1 flagellar hook assembly protein FlgD [Ferrovibrio sp.]